MKYIEFLKAYDRTSSNLWDVIVTTTHPKGGVNRGTIRIDVNRKEVVTWLNPSGRSVEQELSRPELRFILDDIIANPKHGSGVFLDNGSYYSWTGKLYKSKTSGSKVRLAVFQALDNAMDNGFGKDVLPPVSARNIAQDLVHYDADLEDESPSTLVPFIEEWQRKHR